ncbi:formate dehydrogenase accessory sulfurtransferase FdhD [Bowmanella pacifica]|uniref:Sulfur carrier protein FdhD n=1 Tax=Bowmanella pacifica TaxID=502051 RepID=A0A918DK68_9ALTE|nr:formate dehydrogenase accessory sulfurtransferase FdhD [Bowmanella pacifica]GGO69577.1 sulfurtransferase FdhD [Bowmanella pacifica]
MSAQDFTNTSRQAESYSFQELHGEEISNKDCGQSPLAAEIALAISYNGISQAVMMVSPQDLEDFVVGFSFTSGIIDAAGQIYAINIQPGTESAVAEVELASRAFWALKKHRRQMSGTGSCGLCGVEALAQALPTLPLLTPQPLPPMECFVGLRDKIAEVQHATKSSGAMHAALYLDSEGNIQLCREDIGRHNALDKLIGALLRQNLSAKDGMVVLTSRGSLELVQKAIRAGISTLVTLSAPTALTVDWARRHQLNFIHLPRRSAPRRYSPAPKDKHK